MPDTSDKRVVVIDPGYASYDPEVEILGGAGYALDFFPGEKLDTEGKARFARGAVGMFVRWTKIDGPFLDTTATVRAFVRCGVGYDNVDLEAASARGIPVCNVRGYANHSVSDHALALILACVRGLRAGMEQMRPKYNTPAHTHMPELHELTLGIIGLGQIGGTLCTKARGLFHRVLACDPYIPAERFHDVGAEACSLDALLAGSDVVTLHCNLTHETHHLLNAQTIARMRPNVIVINTARGPVVDEEALTAALQAQKVFAAGIDVFQDEPPRANRDALVSHPRVIATGHYAWYSERASRELQRRAALNLEAMLRGELPPDCLNRDELKNRTR